MKKLFITCAIILLAQFGFGQITGTAHDFSTQGWNLSGEICIVCHTPHNARTIPNAPLWNHDVSIQTYTLYTSPTFDGATTITAPAGSSALCLSCHDGSVAIENFGSVTTGTTMITGNANLGIDLSNDHPISFDYNAAQLLDAELWVSTTTSGLGGTISSDMLFGGFMECASCHDVHGTANAFMLLKDNAVSALCLTCHNK